MDEDSFYYLKEIRNPSTMQVKGCMILGFESRKFESIRKYYSRPELIVYNEEGTAVFASAEQYRISEIISANKAGTLEHVLEAYAEHTQTEQYHTVSILKKNRAAAVPLSVLVMICSVGILVMVLGEVFVRYYLQDRKSVV